MSLEISFNKNSALRPFVIGLIGHRQLSDYELPSLQEAFDQYLATILGALRFTPVLILTSVAEGSDRLAHKSKYRSRIQICSVLPFNETEYAKDFPGKEKLLEFRKALDDSEFVISFTPKTITKKMSDSERNKAYRDSAFWICDKANSLYAIWDGKSARGVGGTADTVKYRTRAIGANAHMDSGMGLVHLLASNATSSPNYECECVGHGEISKADFRSLKDFDRLNSYLANSDVQVDPHSLQSHFELLDKEAITLQREFLGSTKLLLSLGVLSVNIASIQMELLTFSSLVPAALLLLLTVVFWARQSKSQIKVAYETFRLMAEVLRVQIWWNSCGIKASVLNEIRELRETGGPARLFLSNTFLVQEIASWNLIKASQATVEPIDWVEGQQNYLRFGKSKGAIKKNEAKARLQQRLIFSCVALAGFSILIGTSASSLFSEFSQESVQALTSFFFTVSLSIAAALAAFTQVMSYREVIGRYRIKEARLHNFINLLRSTKKRSERLKIAKEVGRDSLSEAFRWYQVKSDRQVRPFQ